MEKTKKIGILLLTSSLLICLARFNLIFFASNLLLLFLISIIKFRIVRYITILLAIYVIYLLVMTITYFYSNILLISVDIIQVSLFSIGLYLIIYSFYIGNKKEVMHKDFLFFIISISIIIVIFIFFKFLIFFTFSSDYSSEVLLVQNDNDFKVSKDVIQIPPNRYLLIKQKNDNRNICLFWIEEFQQKYFVFNSMLLEKTGINEFKIIDSYKGKNFYTGKASCMVNGMSLYKKFYIAFLPVNSMIIMKPYSYGYYKDIQLDIKNKNIDLPEDKIIWIKYQKNMDHSDHTP